MSPMLVRLGLVAGLSLLLVVSGVGFAGTNTSQSGECTYTGDWRGQLTPFTDGPGSAAYLGIGACASVWVESTASATHWIVRADVLRPPTSDYSTILTTVADHGGTSTTTSTFPCFEGFCSIGPLEGTTTCCGRPVKVCATVNVLRDGAAFRTASACATP
ncbi:MAG TPA: hypothetical protein VI997_04625 [Candidatus Thermoplasmatota archaeon]|nr:hypothetical protein [Candidatus Thermoplasmatota archaeon]